MPFRSHLSFGLGGNDQVDYSQANIPRKEHYIVKSLKNEGHRRPICEKLVGGEEKEDKLTLALVIYTGQL